MAKVPTGAGDGAGGDLEAGHRQPLAGADELGVVAGQLQAEGGGLGVDGVAAADRRRQLVLERPALQRRQHQLHVLQQQVGGARQLHGQRRVVDVRRGHALVQEARLGPDDLGDVGQEGDDVVLGLALDLVDAVDVADGVAALLPDRAAAASLGITPSSAIASAAWASISNMMRNRVWADQISAASGGRSGGSFRGSYAAGRVREGGRNSYLDSYVT